MVPVLIVSVVMRLHSRCAVWNHCAATMKCLMHRRTATTIALSKNCFATESVCKSTMATRVDATLKIDCDGVEFGYDAWGFSGTPPINGTCTGSMPLLTCRCPSDRFGDRCEFERALDCRVKAHADAPKCGEDVACWQVNDTLDTAFQLQCAFREPVPSRVPAALRALLRLLPDNTTLDRIADRVVAPIDHSFEYFVANEHFVRSEPPHFHVTEKLVDFERLADDSARVGVTLSTAAMVGDEWFNVSRAVADVPARFFTERRASAELRWSRETAPNGTESRLVLLRYQFDLAADRADVASVGGGGGVSGGVAAAAIVLAVVLVALLVGVLVCLKNRRSRYERR
eukprot:TRINITY_DN2549_c0_g1_i2.p1 TRINITY_DN2549_c0_g1~~TRINITY_DN2549_c0_g1_i2.p1  ORF type:complete len:343 (-),score=156.38 TRINITY_DN2549_c0_g1_i2:71-1099(-)